MADLSHSHGPSGHSHGGRVDKAWLLIATTLAALAVLAPAELLPTVEFAIEAIAATAPFIIFAILTIGYLKASGAEGVVAKAFQGREVRMIVFAALLGGLAPFCSCEVIPFIAALLAMGAPLSAVMAFWLSSPLMDPAMFLITSAELGLDFAVAKTASAVGMGLLGGFVVKAFSTSALFSNPLRPESVASCGSCCGSTNPFDMQPVWRFWSSIDRRDTFRDAVIGNGMFLLKWLLLAYLIEALMIRFIPAESVAGFLGGDGISPIILGAMIGAPAYLNGYAAIPLVAGLLDQGMSNGAAMSFVLAGGVSCIPAAIAVWALVKPRIFVAYLGIAFAGSVLAGLLWSLAA